MAFAGSLGAREGTAMKLMHGKVSPFARKVVIAAIEKGLDSELELIPTAVGQGKINRDLMQLNPTGKIPTLVADDGTPLYHSLVIIDYFDELRPEPRLIPPSGAERRRALRLNAIGDGLLIAGVLAKTESARPQERQWPEMVEAQWAKVVNCLDALEQELGNGANGLSVGEIAAGCALGWMDVRAPEEAWRSQRPGLASWFSGFGERPSMLRTAPVAPK